MRKFRIPYIPYRSLLLSTTVLNDKCRIEGQVVINEAEEKKIITEAMEENGITVMYTDHKKLKYFTIKVEALFKCHNCGKA